MAYFNHYNHESNYRSGGSRTGGYSGNRYHHVHKKVAIDQWSCPVTELWSRRLNWDDES